jgi:hypothetical protein
MKTLYLILLTALLTGCSSIDVNLFGTHNKVVVNKTIIMYKSPNGNIEMVGASLSDLAKGNSQKGGTLQADPSAVISGAIGLPAPKGILEKTKEVIIGSDEETEK